MYTHTKCTAPKGYAERSGEREIEIGPEGGAKYGYGDDGAQDEQVTLSPNKHSDRAAKGSQS